MHSLGRNKVGAEGSKPGTAMPTALGETVVSRLGGNTLALWSLTQAHRYNDLRCLAVGDFIKVKTLKVLGFSEIRIFNFRIKKLFLTICK